MARQQSAASEGRLERSCAGDAAGARPGAAGWLRIAPGAAGLERIEAFFRGRAYAPHRHDTYAIGYTMAGVQSFDYRGEALSSLPGQVIVLHPDERHDGRSGSAEGFRYRMLYVEPALIRAAGGTAALPFVAGAVSADRRLRAAVHDALADLDEPLDELRRGDILLALAEALQAAAGGTARAVPGAIDAAAVERVRQFLRARVGGAVSLAALEAVAGLDRWTLARQFRAACGTSPYRFFAMRRLDRARALIARGAALADAALAAGFADQSHMTRHFKRAYGLPPGRWAALAAGAARVPLPRPDAIAT
jgi:AraC-like DNA-binding protein